MAKNETPYCYAALNEESYNALAAFVATSALEASFFPKRLTIVVSPKSEDTEVFMELGKFIDSEGLDFHINPIVLHNECFCDLIDEEVTPSCILREIIDRLLKQKEDMGKHSKSLETRLEECEKKMNSLKVDLGRYEAYWLDETARAKRMKESIKAFCTLLGNIAE